MPLVKSYAVDIGIAHAVASGGLLEWLCLLRELESLLPLVKLAALQDAGKVLALLLGNLQHTHQHAS